MARLNAFPKPVLQQRCRLLPDDGVRRRALARLYERRGAVDQLIESLERYQVSQAAHRGKCIEITSATKR